MEKSTGWSPTSKKVRFKRVTVNKSTSGGMEKMLKGIALVSEQQKSEANLEISLLERLGRLIFIFKLV